MVRSPVDDVLAYHERTKHQLGRFARSLGYMDWATQPVPFRVFEGAPQVLLAEISLESESGPSLDEAVAAGGVPARPLDLATLSQLLYDSLAISAWKQAGDNRWSLRCNPSSGNLHPTEGYLLAPALAGLGEQPAVYHYAPLHHALERRAALADATWRALVAGLPPDSVLVALTSIHWRESWKYGERAFRYCQDDVGHAAAALAYAAGTLGWSTRLLPAVSDAEIATLVGIADQRGPEAEHPDALLLLAPAGQEPAAAQIADWRPATEAIEGLERAAWTGTPNRLSPEHHPWPAIDEVAAACVHAGGHTLEVTAAPPAPANAPSTPATDRFPARRLFHQRRSAQAMDGTSAVDAEPFYRFLRRTLPRTGLVPHAAWPWRPALHLLLFVHRVRGLEPGLYLLCREQGDRDDLRGALADDNHWRRPAGVPDDLDLVLLQPGDARRIARAISCQQEIASDGAFAVAMLARFDETLRRHGSVGYRHLHWEAGAIGQVLYLEAEAAGLRGTGIGCFFDDEVHELIGLRGDAWQTLYHFTVGGPVDDPRLQTLPAYHHREDPTNSSHLGD